MKEENKTPTPTGQGTNASIEERLDMIEKWKSQKENTDKLEADYSEYREYYTKAPGQYMPNMNDKLQAENAKESYTSEDYRLDMGHAGEFKRETLSSDFIDELTGDYSDGSTKIIQTPEKTKLISSELARELKDLASLIKACDRYIANNPEVVVSFKDGVRGLKYQYSEAISHLRQAKQLPMNDFFTNKAILRYNINKFKESFKRLNDDVYDFTYIFKEITSDFIEWE